MAHTRFFGICENKCQVELTDLVVKARFSKSISKLSAGATTTITTPLSTYGITSNEGIVALITVTSNLYTNSGGNVLEWSYYISSAGNLIIQVRNKISSEISGITFNVAII